MKKGFTLVELSIVLVIIGLLIGGILVGQSLIESAKLSRVGRDAAQYKIAADTFKSKFRYLPGDGAPNFLNYCAIGVDGARDGIIGNTPTTDPCAGHEYGFFWKDLSEAKMIKETYNCGYSPGPVAGCEPIIKSFPPAEGRTLNGWFAGHSFGYAIAGSAGTYPMYRRSGNFLDTTTDWWEQGFFTVYQAIALDKKFDDGQPGLGEVTTGTHEGFRNTYCVNGSSQDAANIITYNITSPNTRACKVQFWL